MKKRLKVLIVDEEIIIAKSIGIELGGMGYDYEIISSPNTLTKKQFEEKSIDLIISELNFIYDETDADYEKFIAGKNIPLIYLTTQSTTRRSTRQATHKLGAFGYLTKPYHKEELEFVIESSFKLKEIAAHLAAKDYSQIRNLMIENPYFIITHNESIIHVSHPLIVKSVNIDILNAYGKQISEFIPKIFHKKVEEQYKSAKEEGGGTIDMPLSFKFNGNTFKFKDNINNEGDKYEEYSSFKDQVILVNYLNLENEQAQACLHLLRESDKDYTLN
jgi:response regulator RpfG family c-di-GMP phosphodiesterase